MALIASAAVIPDDFNKPLFDALEATPRYVVDWDRPLKSQRVDMLMDLQPVAEGMHIVQKQILEAMWMMEAAVDDWIATMTMAADHRVQRGLSYPFDLVGL